MAKSDQAKLSSQVDGIMNVFNMVDLIEKDITQTQGNIDLIFRAINKISKDSVIKIKRQWI